MFAKAQEDRPTPPQVYSLRLYLSALAVAWGACLFGYDSSYIGVTITLPSFTRDFGLAGLPKSELDVISANIVSTFQAGAFGGALLGFPLMESVGRRLALMVATVVFIVGAILLTVATDQLSYVYAGRALVGLGVGGITCAAPAMLAEISVPAVRGQLVGLYEIAYQVGAVVGFWINFGISAGPIDLNASKSWRIPNAIQLVPSGMLLVSLFFVRETPRFLVKQGRTEQALANLAWLRNLPVDDPYIVAEMEAISSQVRDVSILSDKDRRDGHWAWFKAYWKGLARYIFSKGIRNRMAIGFFMMAFQNMVGTNAINYYSPRIFTSIGVTQTSLYTGIYGALKAVASVVFLGFFVDMVGRRKPLLWGAAGCTVCMFYLGAYIKVAHPSTAAGAAVSASTAAGGRAATAAIMLFGIIFCASWNGLAWIICSEIYPLRIRSFAAAYTASCQWLFQFIIARSTPAMSRSLGYGMFFLFGAFCFCAGVFAYFFIPEMKGKSLEEMDAIFGWQPFDALDDEESDHGDREDVDRKGREGV